ncbi:hypothetical protein PsAD26_01824 [Pseudovibrio sp. Ad26]|nr:hypothetical protein PsAD26_01824 [Pseudovibrio sp. Ad26]
MDFYCTSRKVGRKSNRLASGFVLLSIAYAFWVIIAFVIDLDISVQENVAVVAPLYFLLIMFFIAAIRAFGSSDLCEMITPLIVNFEILVRSFLLSISLVCFGFGAYIVGM